MSLSRKLARWAYQATRDRARSCSAKENAGVFRRRRLSAARRHRADGRTHCRFCAHLAQVSARSPSVCRCVARVFWTKMARCVLPPNVGSRPASVIPPRTCRMTVFADALAPRRRSLRSAGSIDVGRILDRLPGAHFLSERPSAMIRGANCLHLCKMCLASCISACAILRCAIS